MRFSVEISGENTGAEMEKEVGKVEIGVIFPASILKGEGSSDDGVFPLVVVSSSKPVKSEGIPVDGLFSDVILLPQRFSEQSRLNFEDKKLVSRLTNFGSISTKFDGDLKQG